MIKIGTILIVLFTISTCPDEPYCRQCDETTSEHKCLKCSESIYDYEKNKCEINIKEIPFCIEYSYIADELQCTNCKEGYRVKDKLECEKCEILGCASCESAKDTCTACFDSNIFDGGACRNDKKCDDSNCSICEHPKKCLKCKNGTSFDNDKKCINFKPNCLQIDSKHPEGCLICDVGYYITSERSCTNNSANNMGLFTKILLWIVVVVVITSIGFIIYSQYRKSKILGNRELNEEYTSVN